MSGGGGKVRTRPSKYNSLPLAIRQASNESKLELMPVDTDGGG